MNTAVNIKRILESPEYLKDLCELSDYAANIKQERPIVLFLAKYFHRRNCEVTLEAKLEGNKKIDLVVNKTSIEVKFHYDFDIPKIKREMRDRKCFDIVAEIRRTEKSRSGWQIAKAICKDALVKKPDIFIWVICERHLPEADSGRPVQICMENQQRQYGANSNVLRASTNAFLSGLKQSRSFSLQEVELRTQGKIRSTYYFKLCDFRTK